MPAWSCHMLAVLKCNPCTTCLLLQGLTMFAKTSRGWGFRFRLSVCGLCPLFCALAWCLRPVCHATQKHAQCMRSVLYTCTSAHVCCCISFPCVLPDFTAATVGTRTTPRWPWPWPSRWWSRAGWTRAMQARRMRTILRRCGAMGALQSRCDAVYLFDAMERIRYSTSQPEMPSLTRLTGPLTRPPMFSHRSWWT